MCEFDFPRANNLWLRRVCHPVMVEEKLDGERMVMKQGEAYGRRTSSVTGGFVNKWDQLPPNVQAYARADTWIDGELHVKGGTSSQVKTALVKYRNGKEDHGLDFTGFRVIGSPYLPDQHLVMVRCMGIPIPEVLKAPDGSDYWPHEGLDTAKLMAEARTRKFEGWVIKEKSVSILWWKLKLEETVDLVVTGFRPGRGKYTGKVGAILGSIHSDGKLTEMAAVSGMDDTLRFSITEADMGRVMEVEFQCWASKGRLRHPRFKRWRDDKPAEECVHVGE